MQGSIFGLKHASDSNSSPPGSQTNSLASAHRQAWLVSALAGMQVSSTSA